MFHHRHVIPGYAWPHFGHRTHIHDEIEIPLEPYNLDQVSKDIQLTREEISAEEYSTAWNMGRDLGVEGVLRHVLEES